MDLRSEPEKRIKSNLLFNGTCAGGFSVLEVLMAVVIVATMASISVPIYTAALKKAKTVRTVSEIRSLERIISGFTTNAGRLPNDLEELDQNGLKDSWGHPFQYLKIAGEDPSIMGKVRKDRFLVPLNTDYDLYSKGSNGLSKPPLTAKHSHDDIVRANDGGYVGLAIDY